MDAILKGVLHVPRLIGAQDDNIFLMDNRVGGFISTYSIFSDMKSLIYGSR